jgi:hypothetical protein
MLIGGTRAAEGLEIYGLRAIRVDYLGILPGTMARGDAVTS